MLGENDNMSPFTMANLGNVYTSKKYKLNTTSFNKIVDKY